MTTTTTMTVRMKAADISKDWHVIDAAGRPLGRVATEAAVLLKGKHKPTYEPHLDDGDFVIIVNARQVVVTGRKSEQMRYYRHSGYPGGLRTRTYLQQMSQRPERVLEQAVWGMLPKGSLGKAIFKHLKVYPGPNHPHQSQVAGSERAKAEREAAFAVTMLNVRKPRRLRPLSVPDSVVNAMIVEKARAIVAEMAARAEPVPVAEPAEEKPKARRSAKKVAEAVAEVAATAAPEAVTEPAAEAANEEAPKRARRRKAAEESADA